jgi:hypothetical protein
MSQPLTLHHWHTEQGEREWVCVAYDHGPMCRRCQELTGDEVALGLVANVELGNMEIVVGGDTFNDWRFKLTDRGRAAVDALGRDAGAGAS